MPIDPSLLPSGVQVDRIKNLAKNIKWESVDY
jgi:hypothetical protein